MKTGTYNAMLKSYRVMPSNDGFSTIALSFAVRAGKKTETVTWVAPFATYRAMEACKAVGIVGSPAAIAKHRAKVELREVLLDIAVTSDGPVVVGYPGPRHPQEVTSGRSATGFRIGGKVDAPAAVPLRGELVAKASIVLRSGVITPAYPTRRAAINAALVTCGRDIERAETRIARLRARRDVLLSLRDGT